LGTPEITACVGSVNQLGVDAVVDVDEVDDVEDVDVLDVGAGALDTPTADSMHCICDADAPVRSAEP
jgi:hypothetical protein